jgi:hypothetical protein
MTPEKHPQQNTLCRPPAEWDDRGGQLPLPALYAMQGKVGGVKVFVTRWKPTPDELSMLLAGGQVQLSCVGGQPACNVSAIPPNQLDAPRLLLPN